MKAAAPSYSEFVRRSPLPRGIVRRTAPFSRSLAVARELRMPRSHGGYGEPSRGVKLDRLLNCGYVITMLRRSLCG